EESEFGKLGAWTKVSLYGFFSPVICLAGTASSSNNSRSGQVVRLMPSSVDHIPHPTTILWRKECNMVKANIPVADLLDHAGITCVAFLRSFQKCLEHHVRYERILNVLRLRFTEVEKCQHDHGDNQCDRRNCSHRF